MTIEELKDIQQIFTEIKACRDREQKRLLKKELETCYTVQDEIKKSDDILITKARLMAFQEVLNLIMEKRDERQDDN